MKRQDVSALISSFTAARTNAPCSSHFISSISVKMTTQLLETGGSHDLLSRGEKKPTRLALPIPIEFNGSLSKGSHETLGVLLKYFRVKQSNRS